jgi:hypothetical protein
VAVCTESLNTHLVMMKSAKDCMRHGVRPTGQDARLADPCPTIDVSHFVVIASVGSQAAAQEKSEQPQKIQIGKLTVEPVKSHVASLLVEGTLPLAVWEHRVLSLALPELREPRQRRVSSGRLQIAMPEVMRQIACRRLFDLNGEANSASKKQNNATIANHVRRFCRQINTDGVLGTHRSLRWSKILLTS